MIVEAPARCYLLGQRPFIIFRLRKPYGETGYAGTRLRGQRNRYTARIQATAEEHAHWYITDTSQIYRAVKHLLKPFQGILGGFLPQGLHPFYYMPPASN